MIWEIENSTREVEGLDASGRPMPQYALALGLRPAPFGRRVVATVLEGLVILLLQLPMLIAFLPAAIAAAQSADPVGALTGRDDIVLVALLAGTSYLLTTVFLIVQLVLHGRRGVTLGKALTGIRSVNVRTLERPGFWRGAVVRYLVLCAGFLIPLIGPLLVAAISPFMDAERRGRGWPDLAAATWFVDVRTGLNPYDAKRMRIARKTVATELRDERASLRSLATGSPGHVEYAPAARSTGGVLGAPRSEQPAAPVPPAAPIWTPPTVAVDARPVVVDREPAPVVAPAPAPAPAVVPAPAPAPDPGPVPAAAPAPTPAPAPAPTVTLELDTGRTVAVTGAGVLLGRAPAAGADDAGMLAVQVEDPERSMSKTHLAVRRDARGVLVEDRGSTNGTLLVRAGAERLLPAREQIGLDDGDVLRFGDHSAVVRIG